MPFLLLPLPFLQIMSGHALPRLRALRYQLHENTDRNIGEECRIKKHICMHGLQSNAHQQWNTISAVQFDSFQQRPVLLPIVALCSWNLYLLTLMQCVSSARGRFWYLQWIG